MQKRTVLGAACAIALSAATGAVAQPAFHGHATLATPVSAPVKTTVNGVNWSCDGPACTGEAAHYGSLDNLVRECKQVAASLGQLSAYAAHGREVTGGDLRVCNSAVSARTGAASSVAATQ